MSNYTQGVCHDGAAILKDGQPLTIEQILEALRDRDALAAHVQRLINTGNATDMCTFGETKEVLEWDKACNDTPPNSLARRDAQIKANELKRFIGIYLTPGLAHNRATGELKMLQKQAEGRQ